MKKNCFLHMSLYIIVTWYKCLIQLCKSLTVQNLLIRISAAFFPFKTILVIWLSFSLFYLSYLSSKRWEILLKYGFIKWDRKTKYLIHDEIKTLWRLVSQGYRDSLLFTIQFLGVPGTQLINLGRMKNWVDLAATH